jgi:D-3-phosphoglycerate dehydrogenase
MYQYVCLNPIAEVGLQGFSDDYKKVESMEEADVVLVRSASMHDLELPANLQAIARAGAGVNNIPLDRCAEQGIVVFNTPGANANGVKEMVFAGMLMSARDIVEGANWVQSQAGNEDVAKATEKEKKKFAGTELLGKKLGIIGLGQSVSAWQMPHWNSVWMSMDMTRISRLMPHGVSPEISITSTMSTSSTVNAIISRFMYR